MRCLLMLAFALPTLAAEPAPFALKPGEFPPEGTSHYLPGELIALDHVNRTGTLRPDRTDAQRRGDWDLPHPFTMLPFGSFRYHGAPAELRDIPIGTHLHGAFYAIPQPPRDPKAKKDPSVPKLDGEAMFSRCAMLEDDFSYCVRTNRRWRIDAVDLEKNILTATGITADTPDAKATAFQIAKSTRVWMGKGFGTLADVKPGLEILLNLTVCTLKGPGRCTDLWLDAESRELAKSHQLEVHRQFIREHGLPGWVESVDHDAGTITVALFAGFDPELLKDFKETTSVTSCVAEDNLRTWDQINDRKAGPLLKIDPGAVATGFSGTKITVKPAVLLEGFRPKRVVRLWAAPWKVDDLPREERMYQ